LVSFLRDVTFHMRFSYPLALAVIALLIILPLLFCSGATEQTSHHWLYGIEHKSWPGPIIAGTVGAVMVVWGSRRGDASAYLGYLLLIIAVVGTFRLC
jgi:hypothetical protein